MYEEISIYHFSIFIILILMTMNVFAMPINPGDYTSVDLKSNLLPPTVKVSAAHESAKRRGDFFLNADLIIMNNGGGDIGVFAKAYMSVPVDEVYITIYLDRWDEGTERWRQVSYYDAEFYAKDYPNGLSEPDVDIILRIKREDTIIDCGVSLQLFLMINLKALVRLQMVL